jgi:hypothetical protein
MTADVWLATPLVVTVKVVDVLPAGTVTLAGTVAAELPLESVTTAPPVGAGELSVTVPVELAPPVTLVGFRLTEERTADGGSTVSVAPWVEP